MESEPHVVILASGRGKGMRSRIPKALHPVLFRPMIEHVVELASALPHRSLTIVVGEDEGELEARCAGFDGVLVVRQPAGSGTAQGVRAVGPLLEGQAGTVLVLGADAVLLGEGGLRRMLQWHAQGKASCTIGSTSLATPRGRARVLRRIDGSVGDVREEADCSTAERAVNEVEAGPYCFEAGDLFAALERLLRGNGSVEHRLSDAVRVLARDGKTLLSFCFGDPFEVLGIDDRETLWRVESALRDRVNKEFMHRGVTLQDPASTWIDARCRIAEDVRIEAGCVVVGSILETGATVESHCRIEDSVVGAGSRVRQGSCVESSRVGGGCSVGPYAHLRPGTRLGTGVKVGNFVELKAASLGAGTKAAHLSYIGDAQVGRNVNVGCGFVTCNFDGGPRKHETVIEDDVFIGSDCQAVAPVRVGRGSFLAAGTTVTDDVPPESLALSRGRQVTKPGYARKYRGRGRAPTKTPASSLP